MLKTINRGSLRKKLAEVKHHLNFSELFVPRIRLLGESSPAKQKQWPSKVEKLTCRKAIELAKL